MKKVIALMIFVGLVGVRVAANGVDTEYRLLPLPQGRISVANPNCGKYIAAPSFQSERNEGKSLTIRFDVADPESKSGRGISFRDQDTIVPVVDETKKSSPTISYPYRSSLHDQKHSIGYLRLSARDLEQARPCLSIRVSSKP